MSNIRQFKCLACYERSPFDIIAVRQGNNIVECTNCNKKWSVLFRGSSCCSIRFQFTSIEKEGIDSLKKIQSFTKR